MEQAARNLTFDYKSDAAIYYPWIQMVDPLNNNQPRLSPPSGTIAGMIVRMDAARGIWKAPGGTGANLEGVAGLERDLTDAENGRLNPRGVNCLRSFPNHGVVAWGARTLAGDDDASGCRCGCGKRDRGVCAAEACGILVIGLRQSARAKD